MKKFLICSIIFCFFQFLFLADTYDNFTLCEIKVDGKEKLEFLKKLNVDIVGRKGDLYKALVSDTQMCLLQENDFSIEILYDEMEQDRKLWKEADEASKELRATSYYTASKFNMTDPPAGSLMKHLLDLYNAHPDICRLYNLGATQDGNYDIIAMKVTKNPDVDEPEPKIRIYANIHGDEKGALMVACDVLDTILAGYTASPQNQQAEKLVDETEMWFIPMGNPYGNANNTRYNSRNVDLNRNFWGPEGSEDGYPNPAPWTEKETQTIRDLTEVENTDHSKKRFATSLSLHGGAVCFNSVWNYTTATFGDEPLFFSSRTGGPSNGCESSPYCANPASNGLAKAYQDGCTVSGFWFTEGGDWYETRGDTNDWAYGQWGDLDTTVEVTTTKTPPTSDIPTFTAQHRQGVINYMLKTFQGIHGVMTDCKTGAPLDGTVEATAINSSYVTVPYVFPEVYTDPTVGDFHKVLQPGIYNIKCSASGYIDTTINNLVVTADSSTVANCQMCKTKLTYASSSISDYCNGVAGDGKIDAGETITLAVTLSNPGTVSATSISAHIFSNSTDATMIDGDASFPDIAGQGSGVSISPHFKFSVSRNALCGSNLNFTIQMVCDQGSWEETFSLKVGYQGQTTITPIDQNFSSGNPPTGWSVVNGGTGTQQWTTSNPGGRTAPSGITAPFEIIDSDKDGNGKTQDDSLITPSFDCSQSTSVTLTFDTYYYAYSNSTADVDISINGGTNWTNLSRWTTTSVGSSSTASHQSFDITSFCSNSSNVKIRFHYTGNYAWYWMIDNVKVTIVKTGNCQMTLCSVLNPPGETAPGTTLEQALLWSGLNHIVWQQNPDGESYRLYRGKGSDVSLLSQGSGTDSCIRAETTSTEVSALDEVPTSQDGNFFWYLVTAINQAGEGSAGNSSAGARILNPSGQCN